MIHILLQGEKSLSVTWYAHKYKGFSITAATLSFFNTSLRILWLIKTEQLLKWTLSFFLCNETLMFLNLKRSLAFQVCRAWPTLSIIAKILPGGFFALLWHMVTLARRPHTDHVVAKKPNYPKNCYVAILRKYWRRRAQAAHTIKPMTKQKKSKSLPVTDSNDSIDK